MAALTPIVIRNVKGANSKVKAPLGTRKRYEIEAKQSKIRPDIWVKAQDNLFAYNVLSINFWGIDR
jgi:hypothetical protein